MSPWCLHVTITDDDSGCKVTCLSGAPPQGRDTRVTSMFICWPKRILGTERTRSCRLSTVLYIPTIFGNPERCFLYSHNWFRDNIYKVGGAPFLQTLFMTLDVHSTERRTDFWAIQQQVSVRTKSTLWHLEMALSGTILPSISTFANQKEKLWEDVSICYLCFLN